MRLLGSLWIASTAAVLAACAGSTDSDAPAETGGQDLSTTSVDALAPISPPEIRAVSVGADSLLGPRVEAGRRIAATRTLKLGGRAAHLVVDLDSLATSVIADDVLARTTQVTSGPVTSGEPYPKSLAKIADLASSNTALESIASGAPILPGDASEPFALTVDMCQSSKAFEQRLFDWASGLSDQLGHAIPLGIAMSGGWAKAHGTEFDKILDFQKRGKIAITWMNHSLTHPLHCLDSACINGLFLDAPDVDFDSEVLGLESVLLARSLVPSVIFRFPGLVHDAERMKQLTKFSLLPLDADAWIAKGQSIKPHAVVLVHGNGNEPAGITGFLKQVKDPTRAAALLSGKTVIVSPLLVAPFSPTL